MVRVLVAGACAILLGAGCAEFGAPARRAEPCPPCVCPQCPPAKPRAAEARLEAAAFASLPGWAEGVRAASLEAFLAGCPRIGPQSALRRACEAGAALGKVDDAAARRFFEERFSAWSIVGAEGPEGLVTGYYEPVIAGSRVRGDAFRHPVHGVPEDLLAVDLATLHPDLRHLRLRGRLEGRRLVPYWSRAQIEARSAQLPAPVLAWVADPVELFFLQIQGSGQVELPSGERMRLGYADQNGHPYRSLGRHLIEQGELKLHEASMQGIKAWATANPAKLREALHVNASYVFFRELPAAGGPVGALGVPLAAGYSIAVDPRHVPLGAPVYLATTWPLSTQPLERLVAAQDTGGAIRGAVRADFFWGTGEEAGAQAGRMRQPGRMWLLWPRGEVPQMGSE
jgi:membrane-bound lytic murein transglycosylase A